MSAVPDMLPRMRPMREEDIARVMQLEPRLYTHPWTAGNFLDSIRAGYSCWVLEIGGEIAGYGVLMIGVREAHLLNISVAQHWQGKGHGRALLEHFIAIARYYEAEQLLLEVRPSNRVARRLYADMGFREITVRPDYYPVAGGREDALLMGLPL